MLSIPSSDLGLLTRLCLGNEAGQEAEKHLQRGKRGFLFFWMNRKRARTIVVVLYIIEIKEYRFGRT